MAKTTTKRNLYWKQLGMYELHDGMPTGFIQIGEYMLCRQDSERIWIERFSGEGCEVSENKLEELIETFYKEHF